MLVLTSLSCPLPQHRYCWMAAFPSYRSSEKVTRKWRGIPSLRFFSNAVTISQCMTKIRQLLPESGHRVSDLWQKYLASHKKESVLLINLKWWRACVYLITLLHTLFQTLHAVYSNLQAFFSKEEVGASRELFFRSIFWNLEACSVFSFRGWCFAVLLASFAWKQDAGRL